MTIEDDVAEFEEAWNELKAAIRAELPMLATTALWTWLTLLAVTIAVRPLL